MLGEAIRRIRKTRKLTLQKVGAATGLSPGFLSQVEQNQATPSLSSLRKIAEALETSLFTLLASETETSFVVRRGQRKSCGWPDRRGTYELLSPRHHGTAIEVVMTTLLPGEATSEEPLSHGSSDAQEFAYILAGEVELTIGEGVHTLGEGDSATFSSGIAHRYTNRGDLPAEILSVMHPPSF